MTQNTYQEEYATRRQSPTSTVGDPRKGAIAETDGQARLTVDPQYAKFGKGVVPACMRSKNATIGVASECIPSFMDKHFCVYTEIKETQHSHNDGESHHPTDIEIHEQSFSNYDQAEDVTNPTAENTNANTCPHKGNVPLAEVFNPAESIAIEIEFGPKGDIVIGIIKFVMSEIGHKTNAFSPANEGDCTRADICIGEHTECAQVTSH